MLIRLNSSKRDEIIDITGEVQKVISQSGVKDGICIVFSMHTTGGVFINENADPTVKEDIIATMNRIVPDEGNYKHISEGNAPSHIKASIIGNQITCIVKDGKILLGTWQGIFFYETDGPRSRQIEVAVK